MKDVFKTIIKITNYRKRNNSITILNSMEKIHNLKVNRPKQAYKKKDACV